MQTDSHTVLISRFSPSVAVWMVLTVTQIAAQTTDLTIQYYHFLC